MPSIKTLMAGIAILRNRPRALAEWFPTFEQIIDEYLTKLDGDAETGQEVTAVLRELLSMCERQRDFNDDGDGDMLKRARMAIAKAKG